MIFQVYAEDIDAGGSASPSTSMLSEVARSKGITIVGGSISERSGDHLYNTCCIFGKDGELKAKHRKVGLKSVKEIPKKDISSLFHLDSRILILVYNNNNNNLFLRSWPSQTPNRCMTT